MPNDKDETPKSDVTKGPDLNSETELSDGNVESTPLISPVPAIEQEPQTSAASTPITSSSTASQFQNPNDPHAFPRQPQMTEPPKGKKKKWLIGGIIAGVVALLLVSGVTAYYVYQNPDKVVADGFANVLTSQPRSLKATLNASNDDVKVNVILDLKSNDKVANGTLTAKVTMAQQNLNLEGSADIAATADGAGYLKLNNIDTLADKVVDAMIKAQVEQYKAFGVTVTDSQIAAQKKKIFDQLDPIINKINNRWVKFPNNKTDSDISEQQKCLTDTFKKLQSDKAMRDEIAQAYATNRFVNVKEQLGVKDGSYGFVLDFDNDKAKSFGDAAEKTTFVKEVEKCTGSSSSPSSYSPTTTTNDENVSIELWVSQWSHQITGLRIKGTDKSSLTSGVTNVEFDFMIGYDNATAVSVPTDAIDFEELQNDLNSLAPAATTTSASSISI